MSAPPSPGIAHASFKNRDRPLPNVLDIPGDDRNALSDEEDYQELSLSPFEVENAEQFDVNVLVSEDASLEGEEDQTQSRSASATSSLDPYYFGLHSETDDPVPSLPKLRLHLSTTPDFPRIPEPVTPGNPAMIDRRGLVGVGELATPRWTRQDRSQVEPEMPITEAEAEGYDVIVPGGVEDDQPDSPWTIEAVDGELSEREDVPDLQPAPRRLRTKASIADESGGEEILYPRNLNTTLHESPRLTIEQVSSTDDTPRVARHVERSLVTDKSPALPPSSFSSHTRSARKRTSDEFEFDQTGSLVSKYASSSSSARDKAKEEKLATTRRHRSLNSGSVSSRDGKTRERQRDSTGLSLNTILNASTYIRSPDRHTRQTSTGSTSSSLDPGHSRRAQASDFSHLPPSPSSNSIQHLLRSPSSAPNTAAPPSANSQSLQPSSKDNSHAHPSPNVAHSLVSGTQAGWSSLNDEAAAEVLRKLDGLSGKGARTRASVASFGRPSSSSRPTTPAKPGNQWDVGTSDSAKSKPGSKDNSSGKDVPRGGGHIPVDNSAIATSSDDQLVHVVVHEKTPKKSPGMKLSFTPKRGSTSSTMYTSTPSSRDSASMSTTTSVTSMSAASGRHSSNKTRRNSAGSDISSVHSSEALKDRVASIALNGDGTDDAEVPPVPPLPKDLSNYRSPPSTSAGYAFPTISSDEKDKTPRNDPTSSRSISLDVPPSPVISAPSSGRRDSQHYSSVSGNDSIPAVRTPSKKWSFSNALNKLGSPSSSSQKSGFPLSPRAAFAHQLRKSSSKDQQIYGLTSMSQWSPNQPEATASVHSLASISSLTSATSPTQASNAKTPDRAHASSSRPGTGSSVSTNNTTSALSAAPTGPLSPAASVRRTHSKRLTPSSIPFFSRRSSSQSMQVPPPPIQLSSSMSPTVPFTNLLSAQTPRKQGSSPAQDYNVISISTSTPGTTQKKSSMLSLGLPSLLKSSSRRSLHSDAKDSDKEGQKAKAAAKEAEKSKSKLEKQKKDDKDRSESRISVIINRKRGKTLSSTEPRKQKSPVSLPPMQVSALEPTTALRVAKLKASMNTTPTSSVSNRTSLTSSSSRVTSQTVSSMQKQSDSSLRSRNQLPTIAGSPSVGTTGTSSSQTLQDGRDPPSLKSSIIGLVKETPTKIPRISSRTSGIPSPTLKHSGSALATRRASGLPTSSTNASPSSFLTSEFGVMESDEGATPKVRQPSARSSPSATTSRVPRQSSSIALPPSSMSSSQRKSNRDSVSFIGLRKSSTQSTTCLSIPASALATASNDPPSHRFSVLSPSKGLKLLAPKSARASTAGLNQNTQQPAPSPPSSRPSLSTPSPVPGTADEEELLGDEEMMMYIRRQHAKKLAAGATQQELDDMLKFPEPIPPASPSTPGVLLKSPEAQALSGYEKKEVLDYPSVYYYGAGSRKKPATTDNSTNNYGYDDERGDYLVVNHDHLAYRYEIMDSLGKGSFGQVLNCRDHATGESVAIKIIRNKKRFHHQALVEIKILDSLRKWDADERHQVIKMTEHFYFRNHLCIAMELLSINLYELIKANGFVGFTTALIRRFTSQMLMSLSLMRHHRIVHCDLKPENVLLRHPAKSAIKVIDFGSSCFEHEKIYTYIQSRFYRSPEVILGMNYHMAIDMWSLGCILAELYTGFPIFPGENEQEQLSCIMEVLGIPEKEFVNRSSRRKLFFDTNGVPRTVINSKGRRRRPGTKTLQQVLRCNDEEFVDFVAKCLVWDPERRMKPQAALRHPFVTGGRRSKLPPSITTKSSTASTSSLSSRTKSLLETPKKSLISAPTPLTARTSRTTTVVTNGGPPTPGTSHPQSLVSSSAITSRTYRTSQSQILNSLNSSRTLNGYASSSNK